VQCQRQAAHPQVKASNFHNSALTKPDCTAAALSGEPQARCCWVTKTTHCCLPVHHTFGCWQKLCQKHRTWLQRYASVYAACREAATA
jgi:hypothetical protein